MSLDQITSVQHGDGELSCPAAAFRRGSAIGARRPSVILVTISSMWASSSFDQIARRGVNDVERRFGHLWLGRGQGRRERTSSGSGIVISSGWSGWPARGCPAIAGGPFDEEDVALSAFQSFCDRAGRGQFPRAGRPRRPLAAAGAITVRKAVGTVRHQTRQEAGRRARAGRVGARRQTTARESGSPEFLSREPTPEEAAEFADDSTSLSPG